MTRREKRLAKCNRWSDRQWALAEGRSDLALLREPDMFARLRYDAFETSRRVFVKRAVLGEMANVL